MQIPRYQGDFFVILQAVVPFEVVEMMLVLLLQRVDIEQCCG